MGIDMEEREKEEVLAQLLGKQKGRTGGWGLGGTQ